MILIEAKLAIDPIRYTKRLMIKNNKFGLFLSLIIKTFKDFKYPPFLIGIDKNGTNKNNTTSGKFFFIPKIKIDKSTSYLIAKKAENIKTISDKFLVKRLQRVNPEISIIPNKKISNSFDISLTSFK